MKNGILKKNTYSLKQYFQRENGGEGLSELL